MFDKKYNAMTHVMWDDLYSDIYMHMQVPLYIYI